MHSSAQVVRFMSLCLGYSTASCVDLMVDQVLVESEPLQSKPIKNQAPHSNLWKFSVCIFGTITSKTGKQNKRLLAEHLRSILS